MSRGPDGVQETQRRGESWSACSSYRATPGSGPLTAMPPTPR